MLAKSSLTVLVWVAISLQRKDVVAFKVETFP